MELIQIVDENGNFTGEVMERKEAHDKNLLHNEVVVFIVNDKKQTLLQKRSANKRFNPNKWGVCAGHVDAYESLEDAALREVYEEVQLQLSKDDLKTFIDREITKRESNSNITYFYYVKSNKEESEFVIQEEELSEVKWFDIDEVIDMINRCDESTVFNGKKYARVFEALREI